MKRCELLQYLTAIHSVSFGHVAVARQRDESLFGCRSKSLFFWCRTARSACSASG